MAPAGSQRWVWVHGVVLGGLLQTLPYCTEGSLTVHSSSPALTLKAGR